MENQLSIESYVQQFHAKGFTEEGLQIDPQNRSIEPGLREAFDLYLKGAKKERREVGFVLEVPAVFNQHRVQFDFVFIVNPEKEDLRLYSIKGHLDKHSDLLLTPNHLLTVTPQHLYRLLLNKQANDLNQQLTAPPRATQKKIPL